MRVKQVYELNMVLDNEKFRDVLESKYGEVEVSEDGEGYADCSLVPKGMKVSYRDSRYKKKVKMVVDAGKIWDNGKQDAEELLRKLDKRIMKYFDGRYHLEDFALSKATFAVDIDVQNRESVPAYLKALKRIGRVKGFTPAECGFCDGDSGFCLEGNSNGIVFLAYDLERVLAEKLKEDGAGKKELRAVLEGTEGILRVEVLLDKPKAIRDYTNAVGVAGQIVELSENTRDIFMDIFTRIIPFGDFYKKNKAIEIIQREVEDSSLRRKMLRLVVLVPEKKSLYLAQKAMKCRNIEKIMEVFAKINVSPVTISKRQDVKCLGNIYEYLM